MAAKKAPEMHDIDWSGFFPVTLMTSFTLDTMGTDSYDWIGLV